MRDFLRFLFPVADQANITANTIVATDVAYATAPAAGAPYPQALRLTFGVRLISPSRSSATSTAWTLADDLI